MEINSSLNDSNFTTSRPQFFDKPVPIIKHFSGLFLNETRSIWDNAGLIAVVAILAVLIPIGLILTICVINTFRRLCILETPVYFMLNLICSGKILMSLLVIPLWIGSIFQTAFFDLGRPLRNATIAIEALIILWIVTLLTIISMHRLRIVGKESVDEIGLRKCCVAAFVALIIALCISLLHLIQFDNVLSGKLRSLSVKTCRTKGRVFISLEPWIDQFSNHIKLFFFRFNLNPL